MKSLAPEILLIQVICNEWIRYNYIFLQFRDMKYKAVFKVCYSEN